MKHATVKFSTHKPDYSDFPEKQYEWNQVYKSVDEQIPYDAPPLLGKEVQLTHYVDANLFHDALLETHRSSG